MAREYKTKEEVLLRDSKTGEIRTYKEWIEITPVNKDDFVPTSEQKVNFYIITDRLIPIYD